MVEVIALPSTVTATNAGLKGNVLHVKNVVSTTSDSMYLTAISQLGAIDIENDYPGKVIVIEGDVKTVTMSDGARLFMPAFGTTGTTRPFFMKYNSNTNIKLEAGLGGNTYFEIGNARSRASTLHTALDTSKNVGDARVKMVVDQRTELDTAKLFVNEAQVTDVSNTFLTNHPNYQQTIYEIPMNDYTSDVGVNDNGVFYGAYFQAYTKAKTRTTEFYIDNLKISLVDAFEITGVEGASTAFNPGKDTIKINFTNKLLSEENAAENISVINVETGLAVDASVTSAEGGYQAVIDLPDDAVGAEYKIVVSPLLKDEYGASIASKRYYYDYDVKNPNGGKGWIVSTSLGATPTYCTTEEEAIAVAGTTGTIYQYSWTITSSGKVSGFNPYTLGGTKLYYGAAVKENDVVTVPAAWYATEEEAKSAGHTSITKATYDDFEADGYLVDFANMNLETTIKTTKSTSLYATADAANIADNTVTTKLTLVNPEEGELGVWYIVAAYGQYNEMLGCQSGTIEGGMPKGEQVIPVSFTTKSGTIKAVRVFVWDGYKTMVPYQPAETIYGE